MDPNKKGKHGDDGYDDSEVESQELWDEKEIRRNWSEVSVPVSEDKSCYTQPLLVKRTNTTSQIAIVGANIYSIESLDYE